MKKRIALLLAVVMTMLLVPTIAFAQGVAVAPQIGEKEIVVIREDVPLVEAQKDISFDMARSKLAGRATVSVARGAYWDVWGGRTAWVYDSASYQNKAKPVGYSAHRDDNGTSLATYHYTRTYISLLGSFRGDSGRTWGTGTVMAMGSDCIEEVWDMGVHTVKYGTEN